MSSGISLPVPAGLAAPITSDTFGQQGEPQVVVLAGGQSVVIWHWIGADRNFYEVSARFLDASGQPFGPEFRVNTTKALDQFLPRAVAQADGGFVVVWHSVAVAGEVAADGNPFRFNLFSQRFAADGTPVGGERAIGRDMFRDPFDVDVTPLSGGGYVVIWESHGSTAGDTAPEGYFRVFAADGRPVGPPQRPEPFFGGVEFTSKLVALAGGGFAIMKIHNDALQNGASDFELRIYSAGGVQQGDAFAVSSAVLEEGGQSMVALAGGGFAVTWQAKVPNEAPHVFVRVFDAAGVPAGPDLRLDAANAAQAFFPVIDALADGGFVATWTQGVATSGAHRIIAQVFSANGEAETGPRVVKVSPPLFGAFLATDSVHELPGGEILIIWQERDGLYGRLMEPDGRLHAGEVMLVPGFYGARDYSVTVLGDGNISISFTSYLNARFGDVQDAFVQIVALERFGGLQGGYTDGADARQLIGPAASVHALGGDDVVFAGANGDTVYGDGGDDYLVGGRGDDLLFGGQADDTLAAGSVADLDQSVADRLFGGAGDDVLIDLEGANRLYGGAGNDRFIGLGIGLSSRIYGGDGDDLIRSAGRLVYGGAGQDTVVLGRYADTVEGGAGIDTLIYEYGSRDGSPVSQGYVSIDLEGNASTGNGRTTDITGFENVQITGFVAGTIAGNAQDNLILADNSGLYRNADALAGRGGNDTLSAGDGDDTLEGGAGNDLLYGQSGADVFEFGAATGIDIIADFQDGYDRILLRKGIGGMFDPLSGEALILVSDAGADTVITFRLEGNVSIRLLNFDHQRLSDADFIFL